VSGAVRVLLAVPAATALLLGRVTKQWLEKI